MPACLSISGAVGVGVLAFLLSASPIACGCTAETRLLGDLGIVASLEDPASVQAALNEQFIGQSLLGIQQQALGWQATCDFEAPKMSCSFWLRQGPLHRTGHEIAFEAERNDHIVRVTQKNVSEWFPGIRDTLSN